MKNFCFTVDDNIRFLHEINMSKPDSIFDHPYLALYRRFHERYGLCVQLNLFYECDGFNLSEMTDRYKEEWEANSSWLKLSFHSRKENVRPYEKSGYDEVYRDCDSVNREIVRFASESALAATTTIHYCLATHEGLNALRDCRIRGLLGLYGNAESPQTSYQVSWLCVGLLICGDILHDNGISYAGIDIVLNSFSKDSVLDQIYSLRNRDSIKIMIHEQYFYEDYKNYQPDFEEKLDYAFACLETYGFRSEFFENIIER